MRVFSRSINLTLALFVIKSELCHANNGPVPPINSTSTHTPLKKSTTGTHTPSSSPSVSTHVASSPTSTANLGAITSAPPWGNQVFPENTCSVSETDGVFQYTPCNIFAGTVFLSYFPGNSGNVTYPSTYYDPTLSITLTSPSIYMVVNTITGDNSCGPLGPTYSNAIISMDLTEVSTLQPYSDHTVTTRMGPPQQLTLADLMSGCPGTYATFSTDGAFLNTHPVYGTYNRCHPRFVFPIQLKRLGYPYWMHCSNDDYELGIFDPPAPVPPVSGLLPPTTPAVPFTSTSPPAVTIPGSPTQPSKTLPAHLTPSPSSSSIPHSSSPVVHEETTPGLPTSEKSSTTTRLVPHETITQKPIPSPTTTKIIAVVGTHSIGAVPGSSGIILPNGSTVRPGSVATVTDSHSQPVVISVDSSGVFIGGKTGSRTFIPNPTIAPVAIATLGDSTISAAPEASSIIIGTETALLNGPPVTVGGSVFKLTPTGVVVADAEGKSSSTFAIPTFGPSSSSITELIIDGIRVSATAGASTIVLGTQTITYSGSVVTLSNHDVLSLGPAGLVIQMPGGGVSTMTFAGGAGSQAAGGQTTSASKGIGSIIASIGGLENGTSSAQSTPTTQTLPPSMTNTPVSIPTSSGGQVDVTNVVVWIAGCFLMGLTLWL